MKHDWQRNEDGAIDEWAWESDVHNGPRCKRCGYNPCVLCDPNFDDGECDPEDIAFMEKQRQWVKDREKALVYYNQIVDMANKGVLGNWDQMHEDLFVALSAFCRKEK